MGEEAEKPWPIPNPSMSLQAFKKALHKREEALVRVSQPSAASSPSSTATEVSASSLPRHECSEATSVTENGPLLLSHDQMRALGKHVHGQYEGARAKRRREIYQKWSENSPRRGSHSSLDGESEIIVMTSDDNDGDEMCDAIDMDELDDNYHDSYSVRLLNQGQMQAFSKHIHGQYEGAGDKRRREIYQKWSKKSRRRGSQFRLDGESEIIMMTSDNNVGEEMCDTMDMDEFDDNYDVSYSV